MEHSSWLSSRDSSIGWNVFFDLNCLRFCCGGSLFSGFVQDFSFIALCSENTVCVRADIHWHIPVGWWVSMKNWVHSNWKVPLLHHPSCIFAITLVILFLLQGMYWGFCECPILWMSQGYLNRRCILCPQNLDFNKYQVVLPYSFF